MRARAVQFAEEWRDAHYERGESQSFYNEFFDIFGINRRRVASFEEPVRRLGNKRGFIDLFWKGLLLVEQKSAGSDLARAKTQALEYFPGIKDGELPRYVLVSDFQTFELYDLEEDAESRFTLRQLPDRIADFGFLIGVQRREFKDQDPVNIQASEMMGKLHDALKDSGYEGHNLERFLVRLVFCLFADATSIFQRGIFASLMTARTNPDGSDTGLWIGNVFEVLNTRIENRQRNLDEDLKQFPYVNGDLFGERLPAPAFDAAMRSILINTCEFSWDAISPAIFGSLFQSVMKKEERRAQGAHYTTERNILKVIQPLFLDELKAEFKRLTERRDNGRTKAIEAFHDDLGRLRFFDPACGCGNFLIISYRELRLLEIEILKVLRRDNRQLELNVEKMCKIDVDQFYGIEIGEFPGRIAEVALWMMDHIMNNMLSLEFGKNYARIPLQRSPHIISADALETDWTSLLAPEDCSYVLGNPPFGGAKYQSPQQRVQVQRIARLGGSGGTLDYVTAWFVKAGEYVTRSRAKIAFVATNSITQGEQVAQLWPILFERHGLEISFAHRTFAWGSDARGGAHVHVVIIGLTRRQNEPPIKRLFSYDDLNGNPTESTHAALSPYLFDASALVNRHLVVEEIRQPLCDVPKLIIGSKPIDGGHYIFDREERAAFLAQEPRAERYMHPFIGSLEFTNGLERWILSVDGVAPEELRALPAVRERIAAVRRFRLDSKSAPTQQLAQTPTRFHVTVIPTNPFLVIPKLGSERREYVPIGWLNPPTIPSDLVFVLQGATLWHFGILTSRMHMAWLRQIGGRFKSDPRYSAGIVYNNFPWPAANDQHKQRITNLAQAILGARAEFPHSTMADLYDAEVMPTQLRRAHRLLDDAVDKLYRSAAFTGDRDRVEHLFKEYETLVAPIAVAASSQGRRRNTAQTTVE